jgi:hypothetical protein
MASRMNMLKLVQEIRSFAEFPQATPRASAAQASQLAWVSSKYHRPPPARKRMLQITMRDLPDIPQSVPIIHR